MAKEIAVHVTGHILIEILIGLGASIMACLLAAVARRLAWRSRHGRAHNREVQIMPDQEVQLAEARGGAVIEDVPVQAPVERAA